LAAVVLDSSKVLEREQVAREAAAVVLDLCASRLALAYGAVEGRGTERWSFFGRMGNGTRIPLFVSTVVQYLTRIILIR
jgi:hypothetical protein